MERLTMDLRLEGREVRINEDRASEMARSCVRALNGFGEWAQFVERIHVTFKPCMRDPTLFGPQVTVYFRDPLGSTCSYDTGIRFTHNIAECYTSPAQVAEHLTRVALPLIRKHVKGGRVKLLKVQQLLDSLA